MFKGISNYFTHIALLVVVALLLAACSGEAATTEPPAPPPTEPSEPAETEEPEAGPNEVMAQEMWDDLQAANYPDEWSTVPGKGTLYRGQGSHGMLLSTYLNPEAAEAMETKAGQMPEGAIIVKENYTGDEALDSVTVMRKQSGFDPNHNDWFWAKYGSDGEIQAAGQPAGCISCHGSVRTNDYVFTFPIAPIQAEAVEPTDEVMSMAQQLWDDLQGANYPDEWATVPGKGTLYRGQGPHGMLLSTYLNPEAAEAMESKSGQMPEGAVIVKENYTGDEALDSVTVMSKQAGFDPEHNDWFWAKYGSDGEIQAAGQFIGCISCHGSVRSNDYIFTFPLALISPEGAPPETD